jgi:ATP-dependent RNA helicase RhlE
MTFNELGLAAPLLRALEEAGYATPTPIQARAIPLVLAGRDLLGIAQTGTGKTAAFALPILHRLAAAGGRPPRGGCRALILSPTRELAGQIADNIRVYGKHLGLSVATVFGGVPARPQIRALSGGVDIVVATPGRLLDHLGAGTARLDRVEALVLDEADQMLDQGFFPAIRKLVAAIPKQRQTLFFSATMPPEIRRLAADILQTPEEVAVAPVATTAERVEQRLIWVEQSRKRAVLAELLQAEGVGRVLVFARTKHGADKVVKQLEQDGIRANAIHGNKSQGQRQRALDDFKTGHAPILVATDIAARGIDVDNVTHVVQHDLPDTPESYVHRIGRTARAGASGMAIALCAPEERDKLRAVERLIRQAIPSEDRRADRATPITATPVEPAAARRGRPQRPQSGHARQGAPHAHPRQAQQAPRRDGSAPLRRSEPAAPRRDAQPERKDRAWREADFRDGTAAPPAFLTRGRQR